MRHEGNVGRGEERGMHESPCVILETSYNSENILHEEMPTCGIYARKELATRTIGLRDTDTIIFGRITMWGRMIEYDAGWKSQFGYPTMLYVPKFSTREYEDCVLKAAERYGIDFEVINGWSS